LVGQINKLYKMHSTYISITVFVYFIDSLFKDAGNILENVASKMTLQ